MKFRLAAVGVFAIAMIASSVVAGELTNASVTLSAKEVSTPTTVTAAYTIETAIGTGFKTSILLADFPGIVFNDGSCSNDEVTVSADGAPIEGTFGFCGLADAKLVLLLPAGTTFPTGSNVVVTISNSRASTGPTAGSYQATFAIVQSDEEGREFADRTTTGPTYAYGTAPVSVPTMTEWAMMLLAAILAGGTAFSIQRRA